MYGQVIERLAEHAVNLSVGHPMAAPLGEPGEAIAMANENPHGLSIQVDCSGRSEALAPSTRRQAGCVLVNGAPPP